MPELPEVETMRRGILAVTGCTIRDVSLPRCRLRPISIQPRVSTLRRRIVGRRIVSVERAGKRVVLPLDSSDRIVIEPRMTGLVLLANPPDPEHLRLRLDLESDSPLSLWFWDRRGLGTIRLLGDSQYQQQLGPDRLGPDALTLRQEQLRDRLRSSSRAIKVAMLDQRAIAGIGNLYAAEILHKAKIDPRLPCRQLDADQWRRLHASMLEVLSDAIRYEGSTLSDGTYRNALNNPGSYQHHHRVYGRAGQPCLSCNQVVVQRIVQAQRSTFFCPRCQGSRASAMAQ